MENETVKIVHFQDCFEADVVDGTFIPTGITSLQQESNFN